MAFRKYSGRLIAFEGGEGSGKSTQAKILAERMGAVLTREPGGTAIGMKLREMLLDPNLEDLHPRAETLLMAADRAQHVFEVILPAIKAGKHVVTDRFIGSSIAYQGARGLDEWEVEDVSAFATNYITADIVILLKVSETVAMKRLGDKLDRFEGAGRTYHRAVNRSFLEQAQMEPERWAVVNGEGTVDEVAARVVVAMLETGGLVV